MSINNSQLLAGTGVVITTPADDRDALVVEALGEGMSSYIKNTDDVKQARALFARLREYLIEAGVCSDADEGSVVAQIIEDIVHGNVPVTANNAKPMQDLDPREEAAALIWRALGSIWNDNSLYSDELKFESTMELLGSDRVEANKGYVLHKANVVHPSPLYAHLSPEVRLVLKHVQSNDILRFKINKKFMSSTYAVTQIVEDGSQPWD